MLRVGNDSQIMRVSKRITNKEKVDETAWKIYLNSLSRRKGIVLLHACLPEKYRPGLLVSRWK